MNVLFFTRLFSVDLFDFFPNFMTFEEADLNCNTHRIIEENGLECLGVNNIGNLMIFVGIFVVLKILVWTATMILKLLITVFGDRNDKQSKLKEGLFRMKEFIEGINGRMGFKLYWEIYNMMVIDLCFALWTTLRVPIQSSLLLFISYMLIGIVILHFLFFSVFIFLQFLKIQKLKNLKVDKVTDKREIKKSDSEDENTENKG